MNSCFMHLIYNIIQEIKWFCLTHRHTRIHLVVPIDMFQPDLSWLFLPFSFKLHNILCWLRAQYVVRRAANTSASILERSLIMVSSVTPAERNHKVHTNHIFTLQRGSFTNEKVGLKHSTRFPNFRRAIFV
jgi:hypothetical protein